MTRNAPHTPERIHRQSAASKLLRQSKQRLSLLCIGFLCAYFMIAGRLAELAWEGRVEQARVQEQSRLAEYNPDRVPEAAPLFHGRADILDREGRVLATNLATQSLYANPQIVQEYDVEGAIRELSATLHGVSRASLRKKLTGKRKFVYLKRHLTPSEQMAVNNLGIPGLSFEPDTRRIYPYGPLFAHAIGFVNVDNKGLEGIERYFDSDLHARPEMPLQLSMDMRVQHAMRNALKAGIDKFEAIGGTGIVMDMRNGELLSMVSLPDYDPHNPAAAAPDQRFNRASLGVYEMGSTFKTFTVGAALEYGTTDFNRIYDVQTPIRIGRFRIRDAHPEDHPLTVPEIFAYSSNIGTVHLAKEMGIARQKEFLKELGLMEQVSIELFETASPLVPREWREINMYTISYGHGISVTPLHLVRAIGSLAGPGRLLQPTLLKQPDDLPMIQGARLVSDDTREKLRWLMRQVVVHGTASKAEAAGYEVGGKTGTAEKVKASGGYAKNDKMASFIGVFPYENPRYAVLVMIDEPRGNKETFGYATGGWVAAPVAGQVIARIAPMLGVRPTTKPPEWFAEKQPAWMEAAEQRFNATQ